MGGMRVAGNSKDVAHIGARISNNFLSLAHRAVKTLCDRPNPKRRRPAPAVQPCINVSRNDARAHGLDRLLNAIGIHPIRGLQAKPFPNAPIEPIGAQGLQASDAGPGPLLFKADEFK